MRLDESFHLRYQMRQNTLLVTILRHFTVCTWIFKIALQNGQHFGVQVLAMKPKGTKLFEFHWKYKDLSILNAICQSLMNILVHKVGEAVCVCVWM